MLYYTLSVEPATTYTSENPFRFIPEYFFQKIHIFSFFFERNEAFSLTFAALSGGGHIVCLDDDACAEVAVGSHRGAGLDGYL